MVLGDTLLSITSGDIWSRDDGEVVGRVQVAFGAPPPTPRPRPPSPARPPYYVYVFLFFLRCPVRGFRNFAIVLEIVIENMTSCRTTTQATPA